MKSKWIFLFLLIVFSVSACSPISTAAPQASVVPISQAAQITLTNMPSKPAQSTTPPGGQNQPQGSQTPQPGKTQNQPQGGGTPPQAALDACTGKKEQTTCEFTSTKGNETGICELVQNQMACSPGRQTVSDPKSTPNASKPGGSQPGQNQPGADKQGYSTAQAISDKAQGMTIAYDALAFLTGDLGSDSFFPPGKVADFWGFQYLRDNDPSEMGHAGDFLTSAAMNMLNTLTEAQRAKLIALAKSQVASFNEYGYKRFVLMDAFRRLIQGKLPAGTAGLNEAAVKAYSGELYRLDGQISYARAEVMGNLLYSLNATQRAYLDKMVGKGMLTWPKVTEPTDIKGLERDVKVAVMTYAADMFSWYAGSVDADVYFCPERHGTYFGSFYLKDIHAMSDPTYSIPTNITGDMGEAMLKILTPEQANWITSLVEVQRPYLLDIVNTRETISIELRKFKDGGKANSATALSLVDQYGQLDGEIIYNYAVNFSKVYQSLTNDQKTKLMALRKELLGNLLYPTGAFLYSQAIPMPAFPNTDFLFK